MPDKKLPIGIQSFEVIREDNYYYVDKTPFVKKLFDSGKYYFLSRPRRFGKSLFLDTLRQAFLGRRELFSGLFLENNWNWDEKYPVIYISFGAGVHRNTTELKETINIVLNEHAESYGVSLNYSYVKDRFMELIKKLNRKLNQKVVVLVDEYDKPILDNIHRPDVAVEMREELKNFYSVLKDADPYLRFCFITGVSKFSKVSLFSGLNNLLDITLHGDYGTICGYTQEELETVFADRLEGVSLDDVKQWYDGYSWLGENVYNPFDILLFLDQKIFRAYWFETATPTFLVNLMLEKGFPLFNLESLEAGEELLGSFDVDRIYPQTILFQTGYLTIRSVKKRLSFLKYTLSWPNLEVKASFSNHLLNTFSEIDRKERNLDNILTSLENEDFELLKETLVSFFASIPHDWYRKSEIQRFEGFYASVVYAYFTALGLNVRVEDPTNQGQLDMAVELNNICYLIEFKVVELKSEGKALKQLKKKKYHEKYIPHCKTTYLIGIEFSKEEKNIVKFDVEQVT